MADENPVANDSTAPSTGPGLMGLIKAIVFVAIIVVVEVVAASMLIPSSDDTTEVAQKLITAKQDEIESESSGDEPDEGLDIREVNLGTYHVLSFNPVTDTSLTMDFELFGTVLATEEEQFIALYESNKNRVREQVLVTMRSSEVNDLTDAGLGLIKRKILEKTNRALGKPLLREIVFPKYSMVER